MFRMVEAVGCVADIGKEHRSSRKHSGIVTVDSRGAGLGIRRSK
jgi:hypothetical protein